MKIKTLFIMCVFWLCCSRVMLAAEVDLAWNPNTESDLAGYKVYYGPTTGNYDNVNDVGDVGSETTYTIKDLVEGQTYYIAVTAYDTSNNESGYSVEVVYAVPVQFALKIPSGVTVTGKLTLQWYKHRDLSVVGYTVYYGVEPDNYIHAVDVPGRATTRKKFDLPADVYYFRVAAYDGNGNESPLSAEIKKEVALPPVWGVKIIE